LSYIIRTRLDIAGRGTNQHRFHLLDAERWVAAMCNPVAVRAERYKISRGIYAVVGAKLRHRRQVMDLDESHRRSSVAITEIGVTDNAGIAVNGECSRAITPVTFVAIDLDLRLCALGETDLEIGSRLSSGCID